LKLQSLNHFLPGCHTKILLTHAKTRENQRNNDDVLNVCFFVLFFCFKIKPVFVVNTIFLSYQNELRLKFHNYCDQFEYHQKIIVALRKSQAY